MAIVNTTPPLGVQWDIVVRYSVYPERAKAAISLQLWRPRPKPMVEYRLAGLTESHSPETMMDAYEAIRWILEQWRKDIEKARGSLINDQ